MSTAETSDWPERNQDLRCQTGPSAKDSAIFSRGDSSKNYGQTNNDCRFRIFPAPVTFACWKIRFKTEVCICWQFPTEAMQWIKEVELVDSVDDLRFSSSIRGISMPNFKVLDARIASALNKIIHNSHFKREISLEEQKAQKLCRLWHGLGWPCSRWRSCAGEYSWNSRQARWQESGRGGRKDLRKK